MHVSFKDITKCYGNQKAVDGVTLEIAKNGVTGLLGPNGAGKSTMMKLALGYIHAETGRIEIGGLDVTQEGLAVRERTGYLPEHNPLYLDMYVRESLHFTASLHGLRGEKRTQRIKAVIEETGLGAESHKQIHALSKGYRQRVGLAQALIHEPELLILDEPTTGLDPLQLEDIRALIRRLGEQATVILSTHIMQEVEAVCDRVVILSKGRIVEDAAAADLIGSGGLEHAFRQAVQ
ncbi:MAG: ATP-binding cassette domain-containing protein [Flavobacteriales bacterium]|nr:ATP-binding cassette domain-containing protein [Flavobacteriales bacterium]